MASVFEKLNLKGQTEIVVVNAPTSFEGAISSLDRVNVLRNLNDAKIVNFILAFATKQDEVERLAKAVCAKADGDAVIWFAYPKGTSKNFRCDFNRDNGWASLRALGFDSVRQVAIDQDWSALRFRRNEFIKSHGPKTQ